MSAPAKGPLDPPEQAAAPARANGAMRTEAALFLASALIVVIGMVNGRSISGVGGRPAMFSTERTGR